MSEDIELSGFNNLKNRIEDLLKGNNLFDIILNKYADKIKIIKNNSRVENFKELYNLHRDLFKFCSDKTYYYSKMVPLLKELYMNWRKETYGLNIVQYQGKDILNEKYDVLISNINNIKNKKNNFSKFIDHDINLRNFILNDLNKITGFTHSFLVNEIPKSNDVDTFILFGRLKHLNYPSLNPLIMKEMYKDKFVVLEPLTIKNYIKICEENYGWNNNNIFEYLYQVLLYNYKLAYKKEKCPMFYMKNRAAYIYLVEKMFLRNFRNNLNNNKYPASTFNTDTLYYKCENLKFWIRKLRIIEYVDNDMDLECFDLVLENMLCEYYKKIIN